MKKILFAILLAIGFPILAFAYSDVPDSYAYKTAIDSISGKGIVSGYADGTFKPAAKINRAEFTKIVVGAALSYNPAQDPSDYDIYSNQGLTFSDMESKAWYIPYLRKAVENNVISGYPDGTFKPAQSINLVEASKILVNSFKLTTIQPVGTEWYSQTLETLAGQNAIPSTFHSLTQTVTRGEMAEMVWRIMEKKTDQPSSTLAQLQTPCNPLGENIPSNIDMGKVRATWLKWYNDARAAAGLYAYTYNDQLNRSAITWSETCKARGYMDHKRSPGDAYYDYNKITAWFADLGLVFKNVNRVTHTENIGWGMYKCSKADCTDDLITAIRTTFDFYMAEKGTASHAHYDSVMNAYFKEIGLGIAIDETNGKYYLTTHYGTEITSNPLPICAE
jgi:uncharacterized protein YkwD/predicted DNA-binding antitoxin AbrB/MazE fold protein